MMLCARAGGCRPRIESDTNANTIEAVTQNDGMDDLDHDEMTE